MLVEKLTEVFSLYLVFGVWLFGKLSEDFSLYLVSGVGCLGNKLRT